MRHERLGNIAHGISCIARLVQEDLCRQADAGGQSFIDQNLLGGLMSAVEELASQADIMSEEMADEREGKS